MTSSAEFYHQDPSRDLRRVFDQARNLITRTAPNEATHVLELIDEAERASAALPKTATTADKSDAEDEDIVDVVSQLPLEVNSAITWYMKKHHVSRADLAKRLGVTPGRVSQVLSGDENLTLRTIGTVAQALRAYVNVRLVPEEEAHRV
jgi:antitoxin component HigA of HigAB toxin-antitoxin module